MTVAIDTNILLDILLPDPIFKDSSLNLLTNYSKTDRLIISEVVYSELASQFTDEKILKAFLRDVDIRLTFSTPDSLWTAATAWKKYAKSRDENLQCSNCGQKGIYKCYSCNSILSSRQHIISDFLIAGHAVVHSGKLLTRDRGFYRAYFENLLTESGAD